MTTFCTSKEFQRQNLIGWWGNYLTCTGLPYHKPLSFAYHTYTDLVNTPPIYWSPAGHFKGLAFSRIHSNSQPLCTKGNCESQNAGIWNGTECGMEVMWFHMGNYTEMMQEVWHKATKWRCNGSFPAATLCSSTATGIFLGSAAYLWKTFRQI